MTTAEGLTPLRPLIRATLTFISITWLFIAVAHNVSVAPVTPWPRSENQVLGNTSRDEMPAYVIYYALDKYVSIAKCESFLFMVCQRELLTPECMNAYVMPTPYFSIYSCRAFPWHLLSRTITMSTHWSWEKVRIILTLSHHFCPSVHLGHFIVRCYFRPKRAPSSYPGENERKPQSCCMPRFCCLSKGTHSKRLM